MIGALLAQRRSMSDDSNDTITNPDHPYSGLTLAETQELEAAGWTETNFERMPPPWKHRDGVELYSPREALDIARRIRVADLEAELNGTEATVIRQSEILSRVALALKGEPPPLTRHSTHDLGECAERFVAENADLRLRLDNMMVTANRLSAERDNLERKHATMRGIAGNLLARIHRDGGHHADEVGWEKAAEEADEIVARLFTDADEARRLREEVEAWKQAAENTRETSACATRSPSIAPRATSTTRGDGARRARRSR